MPTPTANLDQADLLLPALVGLAIGCIFPAAVFIVMWITGWGLSGEAAAGVVKKLANDGDASRQYGGEPNPHTMFPFNCEDSRYLGWWTRTGC